MEQKTHICTTEELYELIPECKALYETKFNDISELLINLISQIEFSGKWEFVQLIQNQPASLFIVRKITTKPGGLDTKELTKIVKKFVQHYVSRAIPSDFSNFLKEAKIDGATDYIPDPILENDAEDDYNFEEDNELVTESDKLPWEK